MRYLIFCLLIITSFGAKAQTADDTFKKPLTVVLSEIESRYKITIKAPKELVQDRYVTYAEWRFRPSVEKTLEGVLASLDLSYTQSGPTSYKIKAYQYHLKTVEEGKEQLDNFLKIYSDVKSWEARKAELRSCILSSLRLSPMPSKPASKPILTPKRMMNGYTVENFAIETLPGVYVTGSFYQPAKVHGKMPIILSPDGHFGDGRYRADCQYRCAMLARMGCIVASYDLFAWGESQLQFKSEDHRRSLAQTIQALNSIRILDYLTTVRNIDLSRIAITGASGGGSQTMLVAAIDDRIKLSVPVVMLSSWHSGGCPCESGMGIHLCGSGTNNAEIAAMAAPKPQLVISDGQDWTQHVPENEFPFLQRVYGFYGKQDAVQNVHLPKEGHDYGLSKRKAMYEFIARNFKLDGKSAQDASGAFDESKCTIEKQPAMYVFGEKGEKLPANAVKSFEVVEKMFPQSQP